MTGIRWTWADAGLVGRGLAKASPFRWSNAKRAVDVISQLQRQSQRNQRRPVRVIFSGKELRFENSKKAISFLRPQADQENVTLAKQRKPWENIDSLLGEVMPESSKARVRGALHCAAGHPIQKKRDASSRWFQEKRVCEVCETKIGQHTIHWQCTSGCNYNVCHHCFQTAVWSTTQLVADQVAETSMSLSEASTSVGSPDELSEVSMNEEPPCEELVPEGPQIELQVQMENRKEIWSFDSRPLDTQLAELREPNDVSQVVLVRTSGSELEVIQSQMQLQALVPLSSVSVERVDVLVSTHLQAVAQATDADVAIALRQLLALLCASDALVEELFKQGAFFVLADVVRGGNCPSDCPGIIECASAGLCTLLACPRRRSEIFAQLQEQWDELGHDLLHSLLSKLFPNVALPTAPQNATLTVLLLLLENMDSGAVTMHEVARESIEALDEAGAMEGNNGATLYTCIATAARSDGEYYQAHAGRLVLRSLLHAATLHLTQPDLQDHIRQEIGDATFLGEFSAQRSSLDMLTIVTASCANAASSKIHLLQQEVEQLRHEKKFTELLQGKLRQSHRAMCDMVHFVNIDSKQIETSLKAAVCNGWESVNWSEGYTLLHFLCEYSHDTRLVRLVAELCTDLEAKDKKGDRPIDCALRNPHADVAQCLVEVHQDRVANSCRPSQPSTENSPINDLNYDFIAETFNSTLEQEESQEKTVIEAASHSTVTSGDVPDVSSGESANKPAEEHASDPLNLGDAFMLRTQLASVTKENASLREKVSELEMLRTRLAIITGENTTFEENGKVGVKVGSAQRVNDEQVELPKQAAEPESLGKDSSPVSLGRSGDATSTATSQEEPSPSSPEKCASTGSAAEPVSGKGKGKSKGKGKGGPAVPEAPASSPADGKGKGKGKGKSSAIESRKPTIVPNQDMKTLPWKRFVLGTEIREGETIWDKVHNHYEADQLSHALPVDEMEQRFSKNASQQKVDKLGQRQKKVKAAKLDSIPQDQRFQVEVSLKTLPVSLNSGAKAASAIQELSKSVLTPERASTLARFFCPTAEQVQELAHRRKQGEQEYEECLKKWSDGQLSAEPEPFRWEPVEGYMEELAQVPACAMRLNCWSFVYNLPEKLNQYHSCLDDFEQMVHCFHVSKEIPFFLSLILAFGNYLNGGKNEKRLGQADGFHIELLGRPGGIDVVNDPQGKNVRQLIFKTYFEKYPEQAKRLLEELSPVFRLVQRKFGKDKDGIPQVTKNVRVQVEDLDKHLSQLKTEFGKAHAELKDALKLIADPAEKFVVEIPDVFEQAKKHLDELLERKDTLLQKFKAVLVNYKAETYRGDPVIENGQMKDGNPKEAMTSEVWCNIWDDLFMAKERLLSFDEKKQKAELEPRFCKDAPISVESLELLWGLVSQIPAKPKSGTESRRRVSKGRTF